MTNIIYEINNNIAILRVNRPQARNALTLAAQAQFAETVTAVAQNPAIRALIITGTGSQAFASGGDIKELSHYPELTAGKQLKQVMTQALTQLTRLPIPVIAAVNGDAFGGGCEIITACDLRIAAAHARFSFAQVRVGLTTGWGGAARLVHLIGQSRAMELLLTSRLFDVHEARQIGLIHRIIPAEENVLTAARSWAGQLAALPQHALAATKTLVHNASLESPSEVDRMETELFLKLWSQPDHLEAMAAFVEKRKPKFGEMRNEE